jgi:hypothetical protein
VIRVVINVTAESRGFQLFAGGLGGLGEMMVVAL